MLTLSSLPAPHQSHRWPARINRLRITLRANSPARGAELYRRGGYTRRHMRPRRSCPWPVWAVSEARMTFWFRDPPWKGQQPHERNVVFRAVRGAPRGGRRSRPVGSSRRIVTIFHDPEPGPIHGARSHAWGTPSPYGQASAHAGWHNSGSAHCSRRGSEPRSLGPDGALAFGPVQG
jgi:hypothetical protein